MKDILCLATFVAKLLCLVVFVVVLKPGSIRTIQAPSTAEGCKIGRSGAPACDLNVVAAVSVDGMKQCRAAADGGSIPRKQAC